MFRLRSRPSVSGLSRHLLRDEAWRTEQVVNVFRAALWFGIGAITVAAEWVVAEELSLGAGLALAWGIICAVIGASWLRWEYRDWLPWVLTSVDIAVVGVCMLTGYTFALRHAPDVVQHQVYGTAIVMFLVIASNMLRFSPWISLWSAVFGGAVYFGVLEYTLGWDSLSFVEMLLVAVLGAMLAYAARKLGVIVARVREQEDRLRQSQKMEAVGQITGGVAHDFNNLLTVILGSAELLQETERPGSPAHELSGRILDAAQRGALLTGRLLAYSRRQTLESAVLDLNDLMAGMLPLLHQAVGEAIGIVIERERGLWSTRADASQLENALLNLAVNARDAMPNGGTLTVCVENRTVTPQEAATHPEARAGEYVRLSVQDTGTGMSPEVAGRAFDPFFTTKEVGKGSGLGLSMVYGFLRQSEGYAAIETAPGKGTTLRLYLPRFTGPLPGERKSRDGVELTPKGVESVLVVEDDAFVRAQAVQMLRGLGYTVRAATQASQALEVLSQDASIQLLFSDVVMPGGMNGAQLAERVRSLRPGIRILLTSGYSDMLAGAGEGNGAGFPLILKPYRRVELAKRIREALDVRE